MEALFKEVNYKPASLKQQFAVELSLTNQLEIVKPILNFNIIFTIRAKK